MKRGYNSRNGGMNRVARQITQSFDDNSSNKDSLSSIKGYVLSCNYITLRKCNILFSRDSDWKYITWNCGYTTAMKE